MLNRKILLIVIPITVLVTWSLLEVLLPTASRESSIAKVSNQSVKTEADIEQLLQAKTDLLIERDEEILPNPPPQLPQPIPEPNWTNIPPIKQANDSLGNVLADIESHMPNNHGYRDNDKVTWGHETTHGLNSRIRNRYESGVNAFYCLNNRAIVLKEPRTTLRTIASRIPRALRGRSTYNTYFVQSLSAWNNQPLYICDEWVSYTNGTAVGIELDKRGMWRGGNRSDTVNFMLEFNVYTLCLAQEINRLSNYDDTQFKMFIRWNLERTMRLYQESKSTQNFRSSRADAYWDNVKMSSLNQFAKGYFGAEWCQKTLNF